MGRGEVGQVGVRSNRTITTSGRGGNIAVAVPDPEIIEPLLVEIPVDQNAIFFANQASGAVRCDSIDRASVIITDQRARNKTAPGGECLPIAIFPVDVDKFVVQIDCKETLCRVVPRYIAAPNQ